MVGKSKGNKQVNKNALKTRAQILANTKKWRKPETIWAAANQEERVRNKSKKERITCSRGHPASLPPSFPPRIS